MRAMWMRPSPREERVAEMARMLGGVRITDKTLEHAREMIEEAGLGKGQTGTIERG